MKTLLIAVSLIAMTSAASAGPSLCVVADPTNTPLNVRDQPAGDVIWTLPDGYQVRPQDMVEDNRGRVWIFVSEVVSGDPIGWVFRNYLRCV